MSPERVRRSSAALRAIAADIRVMPRTQALPDELREAIRDVVRSAAEHERVCTQAPAYPEDAAVLEMCLAPVEADDV